jgi:hypothetical protein
VLGERRALVRRDQGDAAEQHPVRVELDTREAFDVLLDGAMLRLLSSRAVRAHDPQERVAHREALDVDLGHATLLWFGISKRQEVFHAERLVRGISVARPAQPLDRGRGVHRLIDTHKQSASLIGELDRRQAVAEQARLLVGDRRARRKLERDLTLDFGLCAHEPRLVPRSCLYGGHVG